MKSRLQPLPKKVASSGEMGAGGGKAPIQPRRMALKFDTSTLVIEYKDLASGKLRHRSYHIDANRFRDTNACVEKLSVKLAKVVVPGSIPSEQLHRLVDKLWHNGLERSPDLDELEAETNAFMEKHRSPGEDVGAARFKSESINQKDGAQVPAAKKVLNALPRKTQAAREILEVSMDIGSMLNLPHSEQEQGQHPSEAPQGSPLETRPAGLAVEELGPQTQPPSKSLSVETSPSSKDLNSERESPAQNVLSPGAASVPSEIAEYVSDFEDAEESPGKENAINHLDSENPAVRDPHDGESSFERHVRLEGDDVDLNNVDQEELDEYKRLMEVNFQKHAILPGDPRYKHDVQVEFSDPEEDCGWDEEDASGDEDLDVDPFLP